IAFITGLRRSELIEAQQYHSGANSVTRKQANPYYHSPAPTSKHKRVIEPQEPHRPSAHPVQHPVQQRKGSGASARKRILIVSSTLHTGGAERIVACLARRLDRERFDVTVCYLKESGVVGEEIERHGTPLVPVPGLVPGAVDRFTWWKLRRLIRAGAFELIHTHDVHGLMDGVACKLLVRGVKHVHTF